MVYGDQLTVHHFYHCPYRVLCAPNILFISYTFFIATFITLDNIIITFIFFFYFKTVATALPLLR